MIISLGSTKMIKPDSIFYRGRGCNDCNNTGYAGRKGIFELLRITAKLREMIALKSTTEQLIKMAPEDHITMVESGIRMVLQGITTPEEVLRVASTITEDEL